MAVEDDLSIRATDYERPLNYTFSSALRDKKKEGTGFYYVFNEAGLNCSDAHQYHDICTVAPNEMNTISQRPSFVYLDCGAWVDNADGKGTKRRDFGLVCGPHVYLCEFDRHGSAPQSSVPSVNELFLEFVSKEHGFGVKVLKYARAVDVDPATVNDPTLYLLLPDLHMPPVTWLHTQLQLGIMVSIGIPQYDVPQWITSTPAFQRQPEGRKNLLTNYYRVARWQRIEGTTKYDSADIFRTAGADLVTFLNGIRILSQGVRKRLHLIHVGDLFELWLSRDYQFKSGNNDPGWLDNQSPQRVADWALEVMLMNPDVFESFQAVEKAGLAGVKYLWGNHDAYAKDHGVTGQIGVPNRDPMYTGLSGDLFAEHGHRFDRSNHDNVSAWSGPAGANVAYYMPVVRSAEAPVRVITGLGHPEERDCYCMGATLMYLTQKYDAGRKPFSIYAMGHTHSRQLFTFRIRRNYHLYEQP